MAAQKITNFLGILPRTAERLLPDMAAQIAENCNLTSGEIRPTRPAFQVHIPLVVGEKQSAYRAYNGTDEKWITWPIDVDVARAPLSPDVEQRYYWTGDGVPRYATYTNFGTTDWALGIPNPTVAPAASATGGAATTINRTYCYTFYQPSTGEETGPSPVSAIASGKPDGTWTITGFSGIPASGTPAYNTVGLKQRLYRTSGTSADFQLVAERDAVTTAWTDTILDINMMGDSLISSGWQPPPADLKGIISLPNGSMCGFRGNELLYSEPYQPHVWPDTYRYQVTGKIIGIAAYGTTVVIATDGKPYYADGVTPDVVTVQDAAYVWPCLSKRSVCSVGDGVMYATKIGMAYIGSSGQQIFTNGIYGPDEWEALAPATMDCKMIGYRLYMLYTPQGGATSQLLRIDMGENKQATTFTGDCNSLYADVLNGNLYLVNTEVYLFDGKYGSRNVFVWKSKEIEMQERINLGAGMIEWSGTMTTTEVQAAYAQYLADQTNNQDAIDLTLDVGAFGQGSFNDDPVNGALSIITPRTPAEYLKYTLLDHDQAVATIDVVSGVPFRLPSGYKTDVVTHQLVGNVRVKYIKVAETMIGLKSV
jgi:hypothetical protein